MPATADIVDAIIILSLLFVISSVFVNARLVIKIDIVNPIPARLAAPNISFQLTPWGN